MFCPFNRYFYVGMKGLMTRQKGFLQSFLNHMKWQSQSYTLHPSYINRRYYRTTQKFYLLDFISCKAFIIIEIMVRTFYVYDYDEENK